MIPPPSAECRERLWAWGRTASAESYVYRPRTAEEVREVFEVARGHRLSVGLRGAGQSYGDAALNAGGVCLDLSRMDRIIDWNPATGVVQGTKDAGEYILKGRWQRVWIDAQFSAVSERFRDRPSDEFRRPLKEQRISL